MSDQPKTLLESDSSELISAIHFAGALLLMGLPAIFIARGISDSSIGITNAGDIRCDTGMTVIPLGFETASLLYSLVFFYKYNGKSNIPTTLIKAYSNFFAAFIVGIASSSAAFAVGKVSKNALVSRALNKKFATYYLIMLMFSEIVAVFALMIGVSIITGDAKLGIIKK